jgi:hypothetical protein
MRAYVNNCILLIIRFVNLWANYWKNQQAKHAFVYINCLEINEQNSYSISTGILCRTMTYLGHDELSYMLLISVPSLTQA